MAIKVVQKTKSVSIAHFQRRLGWGYNRAAAMVGLLQERGIIGPQVGTVSREVFWDKMP